jgi:hypothetical protein
VLKRDDIGIHLTVLVDTGMIESTPMLDELFDPTVRRLPDELVQRVACRGRTPSR